MKTLKVGLTLFLFLLLAVSPVQAGNWYLGGGIESAVPGEDVDFVDAGSGLVFNFGYRFTRVTALDITLSGSAHEEAGIDIDYSRLGVGPKFFFSDGGFQPFVAVGIMSHVMDYQAAPYQIDGGGLYIGFGFDAYFNDSNSLGVSLISATWDAEDNFGGTGDGQTGIFRVVYNYHFK